MENITRLKRQKTKWQYLDRLGNRLSVGDVVYCLKPVLGAYVGECFLAGIKGDVCEIISFSSRCRFFCQPTTLVKVDED